MIKDETILLFDATNVIHRTFFARENARAKKTTMNKVTGAGLDNDSDLVTTVDKQMAGLAHAAVLTTLNKYYNLYNPTKVVLAFDRSNWRKKYTMSDDCISKAVYKGNRRQNMTEKEQEVYERFCEHIDDFEELVREYTGMCVLSADLLEADDLIAGVAQMFGADNDVIIVSADRDMLQLLRQERVMLIDPASGQARSLAEYNMDPDYFMFEKCIRGDSGDNVKSAFPKVRKTRILKAYEDPFEYSQLMQTEWTNERGDTMVVGELFKENKLLMDLSAQPPAIRKLIEETIEEAFANPGKYNNFKFVKFCGKYGLRSVVDRLYLYQNMLV